METTSTDVTFVHVNTQLSHIKHLPPEILGEIFAQVISNTPSTDISKTTNLGDTLPWSLGHVCSSWRAVVHSEPRIWKSITLLTPNAWVEDHCNKLQGIFFPFGISSLSAVIWNHCVFRLPRTSELFRNLQALKLRGVFDSLIDFLLSPSPFVASIQEFTLIIWTSSIEDESLSERLKNITIFQAMQNLTSLSIQCDSDVPLENFLSMRDIPWGRLSALNLGSVCDYPQLVPILMKCTCLKHFSYSVYPNQESSHYSASLTNSTSFLPCLFSLGVTDKIIPDLIPACARITVLDLLSDDISKTFAHVLPHTPNVESLSLSSNPPIDVASGDVKHCHLKQLRVLSMCPSFVSFVDHITAPNLTHLHFDHNISGYSWSTPHLLPKTRILNFLERSKATLLSFHYPRLVQDRDDQPLRQFLKALNLVREFVTPHLYFSDVILDEIKQKTLLPNVQDLRIRASSTGAFADLVESRVTSGLKDEGFIRLKTAHCYYPAPFDGHEESVQRLKVLDMTHGTNFVLVKVRIGKGIIIHGARMVPIELLKF